MDGSGGHVLGPGVRAELLLETLPWILDLILSQEFSVLREGRVTLSPGICRISFSWSENPGNFGWRVGLEGDQGCW